MKRVIVSIILSICLCLTCTVATACQKVEYDVDPQPANEPVHYAVDISLSTERNAIEGTERIAYAVPYEGCDQVCLWHKGTILRASVNGVELTKETGDVYTYLTLPKQLAQGDIVSIEVDFETPCTVGETYWQVQDYVPLVCAYDGAFICPTPSESGDYRKLAAGEVQLSLHAPKSMVVALNAETAEREYEDEQQVLRWQKGAETHLALAASPYYIRKSATVGQTTWEYYATTVDALTWQTIQAVAANARETMGECKSGRVCVVQGCNIDVDGLVGLRGRTIGEVTDKVAAQWGKAHGDAWIEASVEQYVLWAYHEAWNAQNAERMKQTARDNVTSYGIRHGRTGDGARMDAPIESYDREGYDALLRDKGLLFWLNLHEIAGDVVGECVHALCSMDHVDKRTLAAVLKEKTGTDYAYYVEAWIEGKVMIG